MKAGLGSRLRPIKAYLRWGVLAVAIAFLIHTLTLHWSEVVALRLATGGRQRLVLALGLTLLAQLWCGWVWSWVLQSLQQPIRGGWSTRVYLSTNLWKYLPGNLWHFYGRLQALKSCPMPVGTALAGVVLDPVLMAVAALILGLLSPTPYWPGQLAGLIVLLLLLRPRWLNPVIGRLSRAKAPLADGIVPGRAAGLRHYPLKPLLGQVGFVLLRGLGFLVALMALSPLAMADWPSVISGFSLAWCAGLVVPGAPGGLGIFEAAAVGLVHGPWSSGVLLGAIAIYRLISTLAEVLGYGLAVLVQRCS